MANLALVKSKKVKDDEFYTLLDDIEMELPNWRDNFVGKVIYCNCDDYRISNFVRYFKDNFHLIGISRLIATCYKDQTIDFFNFNDDIERAIHYEYDGTNESITYLDGDGSYRSDECLELLKQCDIVVTNPPFSIFREYFDCLINHNKQFIIIGSLMSILYNCISKYIVNNQVHIGYNHLKSFNSECGEYEKKAPAIWYSTFVREVYPPFIKLRKRYKDGYYPKYVNMDGIDVDRTKDIPMDYDGLMGVPVSFILKYNPEQFEIISINSGKDTSTIRIFRKCRKSEYVSLPIIEYHPVINKGKNYYMDYYEDNRKYVYPFGRVFIKNKNL